MRMATNKKADALAWRRQRGVVPVAAGGVGGKRGAKISRDIAGGGGVVVALILKRRGLVTHDA